MMISSLKMMWRSTQCVGGGVCRDMQLRQRGPAPASNTRAYLPSTPNCQYAVLRHMAASEICTGAVAADVADSELGEQAFVASKRCILWKRLEFNVGTTARQESVSTHLTSHAKLGNGRCVIHSCRVT